MHISPKRWPQLRLPFDWLDLQSQATVWSMSDTLQLTITYDEPDEDGWIVARVVQVPGAMSQGRTREEARENVIDALRLMLAPDDDADAGSSEPLELTFAP
jgi:predicted RNase H-like HicB family nuclease